MKLSAKYPVHPATDGPVRGVIVDVTPPEKKQTPFGEKEVFRIVIESELEREGVRYRVWSKSFTPTLNERASLRKFLKLAFGRDVVATDLDAGGEFDVDAVCIGHPVQMIVVHEEGGDGNLYANISHIMPDRSGDPLKPSGKYIRKKDLKPRNLAGADANSQH